MAELPTYTFSTKDYMNDPNIFPVGSYVVLLHTCCDDQKVWQRSMPINHVYKLREASSTFRFYIEKDCTGSTSNAWYTTDQSANNQLKLRAATDCEIAEYKRIDKPFDITKLITDISGSLSSGLQLRKDGFPVNGFGIKTNHMDESKRIGEIFRKYYSLISNVNSPSYNGTNSQGYCYWIDKNGKVNHNDIPYVERYIVNEKLYQLFSLKEFEEKFIIKVSPFEFDGYDDGTIQQKETDIFPIY